MTDIVFIHAFPLDARMWERQIADLEGKARALAPNLPGFGGEPLPEDILSVEVMADHVAAQMDAAGIDRAVIAGCSMGGYAAFEMWRRHRDRVAGLLLVDTRAEADDEAGVEKRKGLAESVREQGSGMVADSPPPLLSDGAPEELWETVKGWIRDQSGEAIARASLGMAARPDSGPVLGEIDVPTVVVVGTEDALTPPELSHRLAKEIPGATLVEIQGAGHLSNLEDPGAFREVLDLIIERA